MRRIALVMAVLLLAGLIGWGSMARVQAQADPALLQRLLARLAQLSRCKGAECRRLEDLPVAMP
ncbi:MAG: hypothetical protein C4327_10245 [Meiothermus sp.]